MSEAMGSGNHLKAIRAEAKDKGSDMGMVVSVLLPQEMEGFGVNLVRFAKHADWRAEFGQNFLCRMLPMEDNTANGFSFEKVMDLLREMNEVMVTGKSVYVHCAKGVGRSLTLVSCYLIVFFNKNAEEAVAYCKERRHQAP